MEVASRHQRHIGRDKEGKRVWLGSQKAHADAGAEAGGVHLVLNPLPGIINQDSHQQMFFDALDGMDKGVLPFTMRASMTMYVDFEESIGIDCAKDREADADNGWIFSWSCPWPAVPRKTCPHVSSLQALSKNNQVYLPSQRRNTLHCSGM